MSILKLIRFPNLIMIAMGQSLLRYTVVTPILNVEQKITIITHFDFFLIVLSTLLIAAGGYIINDIEDRMADSINKPDRLIIGNKISLNAAYTIYYVSTIAGILIGMYLQFYNQLEYIGYINLISAGLLYFYSTTYKGILLLGNIIVSLLIAMSLALIVLTEPLALSDATILTITSGYLLFAFLVNFVREIIKDLEDAEGDKVADFKTLPVVAGINAGKTAAIVLILVIISLLFFIQAISEQWKSLIPFLYMLIIVQIPLFLLLYKIYSAKTRKDFTKASLLGKCIMIGGIFSMLVFYIAFR